MMTFKNLNNGDDFVVNGVMGDPEYKVRGVFFTKIKETCYQNLLWNAIGWSFKTKQAYYLYCNPETEIIKINIGSKIC